MYDAHSTRFVGLLLLMGCVEPAMAPHVASDYRRRCPRATCVLTSLSVQYDVRPYRCVIPDRTTTYLGLYRPRHR